MDETLSTFLALMTEGIKLLPGRTPGPGQKTLRPHYAHTLLVNLNRELLESGWEKIDGDKLIHHPKWTRSQLRGNIHRREGWPETTPQLDDTITQFLKRGLLYDFGASTKLLNLLQKHTAMFRSVLLKENPINCWMKEPEACLHFNVPAFEFIYTDMGKPWRAVRRQINDAVNTSKGLKTAQDRLADNPAWYAVVNLVGMRGSLHRMLLPGAVHAVGWTPMVGGIAAVDEAVSSLCRAGVLSEDEETLTLVGKCQQLFNTYLEAIKIYLPRLQQTLKVKDDELNAKSCASATVTPTH